MKRTHAIIIETDYATELEAFEALSELLSGSGEGSGTITDWRHLDAGEALQVAGSLMLAEGLDDEDEMAAEAQAS